MFKSLTYAARILRKSPGFTAVAVCSLAIGIGATSAMFSFADALLLRPLPVFEPSRIAAVTTANSAAFGTNNAISYPDYLDFRDRNRSFEGLLAASYATFGFSPNPATLPRMKFGLFVSGNFFRVLGVEPSLGRGFRDDEDQAEGRDPVVILGHDFWVSQFGASRSVLGSKVRLNGIDFSVIGVAPERFTGIDQFVRPALFIPLAMSPRTGQANNLNRRDLRWLIVKGRLKPGVGVNEAQADLNAITSQLRNMYPQSNRNQRIAVQTELQLRAAQSPPDAALAAMLVLLSLCVLLVACANVAGLLLSRARARSREIAVRLAIGAGRGSLVRQLLLENLLLALLGGLAGIAIAYAGAAYFRRLPIPTDLPVVIDVGLDHRVLWFTLAVSLLSTLLFGLTPALRATHPDLVPALKATDADSTGHRRLWGRNLIVAGQVALSLVLLVVSAVLVQGFDSQLAQGPGFRTDHLFLTSFDTQLVRYSNDQTRRFYKELLDRTRSAPGVKSAALTSVIPMIGGDSTPIVPEGYQLPRGEQAVTVFDAHVSDGFFDTMGIRLLKGRSFLPTDLPDTPRVAVVNEHLASHYWPKGDALGKRLHLGNAAGDLVQIVGIAKTTKYFWIAEPPLDYVYFPYTQNAGLGLAATFSAAALTVVAESDAPDPSTIAPALREVVRGLDPNMPFYDVRTMHDLYTQRAVKTPNMIADSVAGLGLMGLILATVGLYGLIAYSVSRRTREIGIRMAIGADRQKVVQMILRQGLTLSSAGVAVGLLVSFFVCRVLTSALWIATFNATNPLLFAAIALPLLLITLLASYAPARRASLIDPMRALREE
ncbi:MAG TPA: ABC transporter permease [Bryobacteraceae bacterium]|nr:ABC transporter permease [Bryobacteraceae bacterium]